MKNTFKIEQLIERTKYCELLNIKTTQGNKMNSRTNQQELKDFQRLNKFINETNCEINIEPETNYDKSAYDLFYLIKNEMKAYLEEDFKSEYSRHISFYMFISDMLIRNRLLKKTLVDYIIEHETIDMSLVMSETAAEIKVLKKILETYDTLFLQKIRF